MIGTGIAVGFALPNPHETRAMDLESPNADTHQELLSLKSRIAQVWKRRESLKMNLDTGNMPIQLGLRQLEAADRELSELDSRFKQLWDSANTKSMETP